MSVQFNQVTLYSLLRLFGHGIDSRELIRVLVFLHLFSDNYCRGADSIGIDLSWSDMLYNSFYDKYTTHQMFIAKRCFLLKHWVERK